MAETATTAHGHPADVTNRDFLKLVPGVAAARGAGAIARLINPQPYADRAKPGRTMLAGISPDRGRMPRSTTRIEPRGGRSGWFCPSHGSQHDISGRVRHGPANRAVPPYAFDNTTKRTIG